MPSLPSCPFLLSRILAFCGFVLIAFPMSGQTFSVIANFDASTYSPYGLIEGTDGNFYGASVGSTLTGNLFEITPEGTLSIVYTFCQLEKCADGAQPAQFLQTLDGNFYGVAKTGGKQGNVLGGFGIAYELSSSGVFTVLHEFNGYDGYEPERVVQKWDGRIYGTTNTGYDAALNGTIFEIDPTSGHFRILADIPQSDVGPNSSIFLGTDGVLYFDAPVKDSIVKFSSDGTFQTAYKFLRESDPVDVIQTADGGFYGIAGIGAGEAFFALLPGDRLKTVKVPSSLPPFISTSVQATDGYLYFGCFGGSESSIVRIGQDLKIETVYSDSAGDFEPDGGLIQATDGNLYGISQKGGTNGYGTLFQINLGLPPFVRAVSAIGVAGSTVTLVGRDLSGTTSVSFNGTAAMFSVVSATEISATVPVGATSGPVQVTTSSGTLLSNMAFTVRP
jgi:uncharacterized repeat protein (TIGR03803 family)